MKNNYKNINMGCIFVLATYQQFNEHNNENNYKLFPCQNFGVQLVTLQFPSAGVLFFTPTKTATK